VLVLNATYEPINVHLPCVGLMVLLLKGVAQAEEVHSAEVHSAAHSHKVPSVIRLLAYRHIPQQSRALSRKKHSLARPQHLPVLWPYIFQFRTHTGSRPATFPGRDAPLGEPGGLLLPLQQHKGDRTPEEAGLKLARRPRPFTLHTSRQLMRPDRPPRRTLA